MRIMCYGFVVLLSILLLSPFCLAQTIIVRVINAKNGHPLQKQEISISIGYDKGEVAPATYEKSIAVETDIEGKAQFKLPDPPPKWLSFRIRLSSEHWHYASRATERTQELIEHGIVISVPGKPKESDVPIKAVPGEIIFPARPFTFFERLLFPIEKG
jgi:hypothetical protein